MAGRLACVASLVVFVMFKRRRVVRIKGLREKGRHDRRWKGTDFHPMLRWYVSKAHMAFGEKITVIPEHKDTKGGGLLIGTLLLSSVYLGGPKLVPW